MLDFSPFAKTYAFFIRALYCIPALSATAEDIQQWSCKKSQSELKTFKTSGFNIFICAGEKEDIAHVCLYVNGHL